MKNSLKLFAALLLAGSTSFASISVAHSVEVYLFRGAGDLSYVNKNLHFSKGLDRIAKQMNAEGIHAEVRRFEEVEDAMKTIRKRKPTSVAFIGHSMGALASMNLARRMRAEGIRVAYLGVIDIPGPVGLAGDNVEWAENFYSLHPVYGRFTNAKRHPRAENVQVSGFLHSRMDDSPYVQDRLMNAVRQVHFFEDVHGTEQMNAAVEPALDLTTTSSIEPQQQMHSVLQATPQPLAQPEKKPSLLQRAGQFLNKIRLD